MKVAVAEDQFHTASALHAPAHYGNLDFLDSFSSSATVHKSAQAGFPPDDFFLSFSSPSSTPTSLVVPSPTFKTIPQAVAEQLKHKLPDLSFMLSNHLVMPFKPALDG